ncbi:MAG: acetyl-CoA carboxylase carboxyltransferase subunit alpha [Thermoguttaceae bacterium]
MSSFTQLAFESPIFELESRIETLRHGASTPENRDEIRLLRKALLDLQRQIYSSLSPWETVEVARHPERPQTVDYIDLIFDEFVELHGDKFFGDDPAIRTGWAKFDESKVMVVGHQKGRNIKERQACHFGCAHPEGYRKAIAKMKLAAKFSLPIVCFIDTPGAFPGVEAEERGQAQVIAEAMFEMSILPTPIVCVVIGEGGSGGALGIGVGDSVAMLEHSYYSVISPEGCAGILWKGHEHKDKAAAALKMRARDLLQLGVIETVIEEPLGGAHRDPHLMASRLKTYLRGEVQRLSKISAGELTENRYKRFRALGVFVEE